MSGALLTDTETKRFTEYLIMEAETAKTSIKQFEKLKLNPHTQDALVDREKRVVASCLLIIDHINGGELQQISS